MLESSEKKTPITAEKKKEAVDTESGNNQTTYTPKEPKQKKVSELVELFNKDSVKEQNEDPVKPKKVGKASSTPKNKDIGMLFNEAEKSTVKPEKKKQILKPEVTEKDNAAAWLGTPRSSTAGSTIPAELTPISRKASEKLNEARQVRVPDTPEKTSVDSADGHDTNYGDSETEEACVVCGKEERLLEVLEMDGEEKLVCSGCVEKRRNTRRRLTRVLANTDWGLNDEAQELVITFGEFDVEGANDHLDAIEEERAPAKPCKHCGFMDWLCGNCGHREDGVIARVASVLSFFFFPATSQGGLSQNGYGFTSAFLFLTDSTTTSTLHAS